MATVLTEKLLIQHNSSEIRQHTVNRSSLYFTDFSKSDCLVSQPYLQRNLLFVYTCVLVNSRVYVCVCVCVCVFVCVCFLASRIYLRPSCGSLTNFVALLKVEDGQPWFKMSVSVPSNSISTQVWLKDPRELDWCKCALLGQL